MAEGRGSSQAAPQQLLEVARRHITTPDAVKYTTDLEGELDSDALLAHKQLIIDFRAIAPSGGIKQSAMKDVLVILGRENECARHLAGQLKGWADGALAIPVAFFIAWGGLGLARENLRYLMGEAPEEAVLDELRSAAAAVPGVLHVGRMRAQYAGPTLQVDVCILVPAGQRVEEAHDVSVAVQRALEADERVELAFVHVDTELDGEHH
jgi:hypothetical protein